MFAWLTLAVLALSIGALSRIPRPLLRSYCLSFAARHGVSVQLGLTLLAALTVAMLFVTVLNPGRSPVMEQVNAAVVALGVIAGGYDLYLFVRSSRSPTRAK